MKARYTQNIADAESQILSIRSDQHSIDNTVKKALEIMANLGTLYIQSGPSEKQTLLGSIFPEMIEFDGNKCRTSKINPAIPLCLSIDKGLGKCEKWIPPQKLEVSTLVGVSGLISTFKT